MIEVWYVSVSQPPVTLIETKYNTIYPNKCLYLKYAYPFFHPHRHVPLNNTVCKKIVLHCLNIVTIHD